MIDVPNCEIFFKICLGETWWSNWIRLRLADWKGAVLLSKETDFIILFNSTERISNWVWSHRQQRYLGKEQQWSFEKQKRCWQDSFFCFCFHSFSFWSYNEWNWNSYWIILRKYCLLTHTRTSNRQPIKMFR